MLVKNTKHHHYILYGEILDSWLVLYHVYIGFHVAMKAAADA
jgi:hypothetical protein